MSLSCLQADHSWGPTLPTPCHGGFDFTIYFEQIWLSAVPSILFLVSGGPRLWQLCQAPVVIHQSRSQLVKLGTISLLIVLQLTLLPLWSLRTPLQTSASIPAAVFSLVAALGLALLSFYEHQRSVRPSTLLSIYLVFSVLFDAVQARSLWLRSTNGPIAAVFTAALAVKLIITVLEGREKRAISPVPGIKLSPETTSSIYNRTVFWWLNRLFLAGYKSTLRLNDLYPLESDMTSAKLGAAIENAWMKAKQTRPYALLFTTAVALKWALLSPVAPRIALIGFKYCQPLLLASVVNYVQLPDPDRDRNVGYGLIGATAIVYIGIAVSTGLYNLKVYRSTVMIRGSLVSIIYRKTLRLHLNEAKSSAALTLASSDVDRIGLTVESGHEIWASSIETILALVLLQRQLGWASIAPVLLALLATAANTRIAKYVPRRQREWGAAIQKRITLTSAVLRNMKSVKMMGLQETIARTIQRARTYELDLSKRYRSFFAYMAIISTIPLQFSAPFAFALYVYGVKSHHRHDSVAAQIFASLSLTQLLATPLQKVLSSIPSFAGSLGSFARIEAYLRLDDRVDGRNSDFASSRESAKESIIDENQLELGNLLTTGQSKAIGKRAISVQEADISYSADSHPILHKHNFEIPKGLLNVVVGPVSCGKTTLLNALLGEITISSGKVMVDHSPIAYCQQTPWLINASVKENILNHSPYDQTWYKRVTWSCGLDEDIEQLPDGDATLVGSRGTSLSGGQKQRLALARAVYARAPLVILDDTLSALDARTEKLVFDRLLSKTGLFQQLELTVMLVTHSVQHLRSADNIIVLDSKGRMEQHGSFTELSGREGPVRRLLADCPPDKNSAETNSLEPSSGSVSLSRTGGANVSLPRAAATPGVKRKPTSDSAVLMYYLKSIGWYRASIFLLTSLAYVFCTSFTQIWVQWWTESKNRGDGSFLGVYFALAVGAVVNYSSSIWCMMISIVPISAAKLHWQLLDSVIHAPMSFFSTVDSGITLNRFSQDMSLINSRLPVSTMQATPMAFQALAQIALIAVGSTYLAIAIPLCLGATWALQRFYLRTSRQLRLLDLELKSPLFSSISETLEGLPTIRAFGWQEKFERRNQERLDASQRPVYLLYCIQRWLNFVLDLIVAALAILLVSLATQLPSSTSGGRLGVAMLSILGFSQSLSQFIFFYTDLETSLQAVSRVKEFVETTVSEEAGPGSLTAPPEHWPVRGAVEFQNITASYSSDMDSPVLNGISLVIQTGQKVGICGRTGSGKSSLLSALFCMIELQSGSITVDGIDLNNISRQEVRSRLIAIPQDPFLLPGTVRFNASPDETVADNQITEALEKVGLWEHVQKRGGLDTDIGILSLSHGQQQLFCLARAILRPGTILVLDEATSNVDWGTDEVMQRVIREEFANKTVITVAHRLRTILDSDLVVVLGEGCILEVGHPGELLATPGQFRELCSTQGITIDSF
ncbi:metal resistance protein YCF1 [Aspergillus udagawae]|uniref:Metal resistance protein YCF1 n=1 Tax=Aspergillus udagawae TaxID=91492 RepID=A0A8H3S4I1_9EURO|nr:metal resistance protein YCF1 [Aspergillus udagawae]